MTSIWIIVAVVVVGVIVWMVMRKKGGPLIPKKPEGPSATPPSPPEM